MNARNMPSNLRDVEQRGAGGSAPPPRPPAPAAAAPAPAPARKMQERKAPQLFSFKARGDLLEGKLLRIDRVEVKGKMVTQYTFASGEETIKILGTYDIDTKLRPSDLGRWIQIAYVRDRDDISKNGNPMKEFEILVEEEKTAAAPASHEITDEDIPF